MFHTNEHIIITSDQLDDSNGKKSRALRKRASTWDAGKIIETNSPLPTVHAASSRFLHNRQTSASSQFSQYSTSSKKSFDNPLLSPPLPPPPPLLTQQSLTPRGMTSEYHLLRKHSSTQPPLMPLQSIMASSSSGSTAEVHGLHSDAVNSWLSSPPATEMTLEKDSPLRGTVSTDSNGPSSSVPTPDVSGMITPRASGGISSYWFGSHRLKVPSATYSSTPDIQYSDLQATINTSTTSSPRRINVLSRKGTDGSASFPSHGSSSLSNLSPRVPLGNMIDIGPVPSSISSDEDRSMGELSYEEEDQYLSVKNLENLDDDEEDRKAPHSLIEDDTIHVDEAGELSSKGLHMNMQSEKEDIIDETNGLAFTPLHKYNTRSNMELRPGALTFTRSEMILSNTTKPKLDVIQTDPKYGWLNDIFCKFCCCCIPREVSWSRVSTYVVRHAPCFWCCFCLRRPTLFMTDRMTLVRLNILCAFFALWQFGVGIFIIIVTLSEAVADRGVDDYSFHYREALTPNLWMMSGSLLFLSFVGLVLLISLIISIPIIKRVNLLGALRFMWVLHWILPLQIFLCTALFDYHSVTDVWIRHWWHSPSMAWYRRIFCKSGTENDECAVPNGGGSEYEDENEWCFAKYQSYECISIRKAAVDDMTKWCYFFFYGNSIIGCLLCLLLLLVNVLLEGIISAPIVQRSRERNIPLWLTLPICGSFLAGLILLKSPQSLVGNQSGSSIYWIGVCYVISGSTFTASALLGWLVSKKTVLNAGDKMQKKIAVYLFIVLMILTCAIVIAIFIASIAYSLSIVNIDLPVSMRGKIACLVDVVGSCSCCDEDTCVGSQMCPEWEAKDVVQIIQTQLKQSGSLAALFAIYALFALRFGFDLKASVSKYEIDYV